jgi:hypothetical protein
MIKDYKEIANLLLTIDNWQFLEELYIVLDLFNEYTKISSEGHPTIGITPSIFFELKKYFTNVINREGKYSTYDIAITSAFLLGMPKFQKYYNYINTTIIYFVAAVLDLRLKGKWICREHPDANNILSKVEEYILGLYPRKELGSIQAERVVEPTFKSLEQRVLETIHQTKLSTNNITKYFELPPVEYDGNRDSNWVLNW